MGRDMLKDVIKTMAGRLGYTISKTACRRDGGGKSAMGELKRLMNGVIEPVVFDVGGHHGMMVKAFRELLPDSRVYSFEPFHESFEVLKANVAGDSRVRVFNYGLGEEDGPRTFHVNEHEQTNSLLPTDGEGAVTWGEGLLTTQRTMTVEIRTLDAVMKELEVPRIDLLKLDVQGAEHLVMAGGRTACAMGNIQVLYSEIITRPTYQGQKRLDEALRFYHELGFDLHNFYNASLTRENQLRQVDAIFVRRGR